MMVSVNDIKTYDYWVGTKAGDENLAPDEMSYLAQSVWHPVSDPPSDHECLVVCIRDKEIDITCPQDVRNCGDSGVMWARIRDVVLMPPEE